MIHSGLHTFQGYTVQGYTVFKFSGLPEFSKPYSEEEHQDRGITLGLYYVFSEPSAVNSVLDSYLLTIPKEIRDALSEITFSTSEDRLAALERVSGREEGRSASMLFV